MSQRERVQKLALAMITALVLFCSAAALTLSIFIRAQSAKLNEPVPAVAASKLIPPHHADPDQSIRQNRLIFPNSSDVDEATPRSAAYQIIRVRQM